MSENNRRLDEHLKYLKLPFIREHYQGLAVQATEKHLPHIDYLEKLADGEAAFRRDHSIQRRIRQARFPVIKTLDQFNWSWPKKLNRLQVKNLFRLQFIPDKPTSSSWAASGWESPIWPPPSATRPAWKDTRFFLPPLSMSSTRLPRHKLPAA